MSAVYPNVLKAELTNIDYHRCTPDSNTFSIKLCDALRLLLYR